MVWKGKCGDEERMEEMEEELRNDKEKEGIGKI